MSPDRELPKYGDELTCPDCDEVFNMLHEMYEHQPCRGYIVYHQWARAHGIDQRVTVADVERIEGRAVGHIDYATKLCLYVAEFVYGVGPWIES